MAIITLASATRSNLLALSKTTSLVERTQERLSTGQEIATPQDDAQKYFQAKSLGQRAKNMSDSKSAIRQGISALETALIGFNSVEELLGQIKGTLDTSRSQSQAERAETEEQIRELAKQIQRVVDDSSYQGLNLLNTSSSKLTVRFSEKSDSKLSVDGNDLGLTALWYVKDEFDSVALYGQLRTDMGFFGPAGWNIEGSLGAYLSNADFTIPEELARYNNMVDYIQNILGPTLIDR